MDSNITNPVAEVPSIGDQFITFLETNAKEFIDIVLGPLENVGGPNHGSRVRGNRLEALYRRGGYSWTAARLKGGIDAHLKSFDPEVLLYLVERSAFRHAYGDCGTSPLYRVFAAKGRLADLREALHFITIQNE
jgi:hypothetical protein